MDVGSLLRCLRQHARIQPLELTSLRLTRTSITAAGRWRSPGLQQRPYAKLQVIERPLAATDITGQHALGFVCRFQRPWEQCMVDDSLCSFR